MHMKIEGKKLAHMLDTHKQLVNEIKIKFKTIGVSITSVSPDHVGMITTFLYKDTCLEYDLSKTGELEIGIDIHKLRDFLKLGKPKDIFTFDYDIETFKLIVKLGNIIRTMGLIDTEGLPDPEPITLSMKNKVIVDTKIFYNSFKGVLPDKKRRWFDEINLTISEDTSKDTIILVNQDSENEDKKAVIERDFVQDVIAPISITNIYDADMLNKQLNEYKKFFDNIVIGLVDKGQPLCILGKNQDMEIEYWLAPRMADGEYSKQSIIENKKVAAEPEIKEPGSAPEIEVKEPETPEKPSLEPIVSTENLGFTGEKQPSKAQKRPIEPVVAVQKTKKSMKERRKDIGWLASPKDDFYLVGEIVAVTKTGYMILFRGSKKHKDPVEINRDLVEVYRK